MKLEKIRFIGIGAPDCRVADLVISTVDERGDPVDTVIWLRNGGGKTALLGMFFAHLLPDAREFLRGRKENARFADHVLEGDTAYVLASWVGETATPSILGDNRPRLVTGRVTERRPGAASGSLSSEFFSFRPVPGVLDIDSIPWQVGGQRLSLAAFVAEMHGRSRLHPEVDFAATDRQGVWAARLQDLGLDPQVFRYQRQMNAGEGEAASGFMQFRTSDEFVDFLLGVVTPATKLESLEEQVRRFSGKLRRLPEFRVEHEFIQGAIPLLRTHADHLRVREQLDGERNGLVTGAANLRDRLSAGTVTAGEQAGRAHMELDRLDEQRAGVRVQREDLQARLREVAYRIAVFAEEAAGAAHALAEKDLVKRQRQEAAWRLAEPLAQARAHHAERTELETLLQERIADAAPLHRQVQQTGAALRLRLVAAAAEVAQSANEDVAAAVALAAEADACRTEASRLRDEARDLRRDITEATKAVHELDQTRKALRSARRLLPDETAGAGLERWQREEREARNRSVAARVERQALEREDVGLQANQIAWTEAAASAAQQAEGYRAVLRSLQAERQSLWDDETLRSAVELDQPDLWREHMAIDQALHERWLEIVDEQVRDQARSSEDQRIAASVETRGTLPPSLDAERALEVLRRGGIATAYPGWDYLRRAVEGAASADALLRAPELAAGIVLNDPSEIERARALLAAEGFQPTTLMGVGTAEGFDRPTALAGSALWPPHPGLYDPQAAEPEREHADVRLAAADERRRALQAAAQAVGRVRERLRVFVETYPRGELERLTVAAESAETQARDLRANLTVATARRSVIAARLAALRTEDEDRDRWLASLPAILVRLENLAQREASELEWRHRVASGPALAADLEHRCTEQLERNKTLLEERDRRLQGATLRQSEAQRLREEAGGLPDADAAQDVPPESVDELRVRFRTLSDAYRQRLGQDNIAAQLNQLQAALDRLQPEIQGAAPEVRELAERLLASGDGQSVGARRAALAAAEGAHRAAIAAEALARKALGECRGKRAEAENARGLAPRDDVLVASAAAAADLQRRLSEEEREAERYENTLHAQRGVFQAQHEQAQERAKVLTHAGDLLAAGFRDALPDPREDAEPFAGSGLEAEGAAQDAIKAFHRADRDLAAASGRVSESAEDLRRYGEDDRYARLGQVLTLRLRDPGDGADAVVDVAKEFEIRLPGLRADIESAESDKRMVLRGLVQAAHDGFRALQQIQNASKLPEGLDAWSGVPFIQIHYEAPRGEEEWDLRLGPVLQDWVARDEVPVNSGITMLRQAVRAANGRGVATAAGAEPGDSHTRSSFHVTLLKPDAILTTQRYAVEATKFSEGQDLTTAILLYCAFINLRVRRGGGPPGAAGALILDNPIGKASLEQLITLQRRVAEIMGVQIIATTGVKDREAISHYPKIVGIRAVRSRDARMRYLTESDDPMGLGGLSAAELVVRRES